ncbi:MAG: LicD family protein [Clostridiales bacterium]|nr:LicD family protein [Candidatus Crickella caballi]
MMKEIDEVCRKNDIHYSLGGGTAIGAIRHKGFIPWDDDIDLYMTRENWERFKEVGRQGGLPVNRVIESAETDIRYTNTFGRYVTTDSSAVHSHQIVYDDPAGHVIDIFVFDPLHIDNYWKFLEDYMLYCDLVDESKSYSTRYDLNVDRYDEYYRRCCREGRQTVINELIDSFTHLDKPGWQHYIMEWGSAHFLFPASIFNGGYIRVPFEDTTVEIVRNYSEYLTWQYGDEWQYIPKHDGREGHDAIFSNDIDYTAVRDDYRPFVDFEETRKAYIRRKKRLLKANTHRRTAQLKELETKANGKAKELASKLAESGLTDKVLGEMLRANRFDELSEVFKEYLDAQLSAGFIGRKDKHSKLRMYLFPQLIPVDDELLEIALELLVRTEKMSMARRLIDVYEQRCAETGTIYRDGIKAIRQEIDEARALVDDYSLSEGDKHELLVSIEEYLSKYPKNSQIRRLKIRVLLESADDDGEALAEVRRLTAELAGELGENHPAQGELLKYLADADRIEHGLNDEIRENYLAAYKLTDNGYIRLETEELLGAVIQIEESEEETATAEPVKPVKSKGLYGFAKSVYKKIAGKDDFLKNRAWEIACRTRDRVVLLEKYEPLIPELEKLEQAGKWAELGEIMAEHEAAVLRNYGLGLGLSVHPILTQIQNELFGQSGRAELAQKIEALIPEQHRKPIGKADSR